MVPKTALDVDSPTGPSQPTRQRILRVAKSLFTSRGFEHASTSAIARTAGTSESQLMKHFGSKAGLLEAIFLEGWKGMTENARQNIQAATSPPEKLQRLAAGALLYLERDPEWKQLLLLEARRIRKEGQLVAISEGFLEFVRLVDGVLYEMHAMNLLRPGIPPQAVRSALIGMLEGMSRDRFLANQLGFPADFDASKMGECMTLALGAFMAPRPAQA